MYKQPLNINQDANFIFMLDMNMDAPAGSCFKTTVVPTTLKGIAMRKAWEAAHSTTPSVAPLAPSKAQNMHTTPTTPTSRPAPLAPALTPEARLSRRRSSRTASMVLPVVAPEKAELKAEPVMKKLPSTSASCVVCNQQPNVPNVPGRLPAHLRRCSNDAPMLAMPSAGPSVCDKPRSPACTRHVAVPPPPCQQHQQQQEAKVAPVCVSREGTQSKPVETIWEREVKKAVDAAYYSLVDHAAALLGSWAF